MEKNYYWKNIQRKKEQKNFASHKEWKQWKNKEYRIKNKEKLISKSKFYSFSLSFPKSALLFTINLR